MNANEERVPTGADLEAKRKQWPAARDALTAEERWAARYAELLKRQVIERHCARQLGGRDARRQLDGTQCVAGP